MSFFVSPFSALSLWGINRGEQGEEPAPGDWPAACGSAPESAPQIAI